MNEVGDVMDEKRKERAIVRIAQVLGDAAADGLLDDPDGDVDEELIRDLETSCIAWLKRRGRSDPAAHGWEARDTMRRPRGAARKR